MEKINVRETLRKASRLLRQHGWQKGNTGTNPGQRMCIIGAINMAHHGAPAYQYHGTNKEISEVISCAKKVVQAMNLPMPVGYGRDGNNLGNKYLWALAEWNNNRSTTQKHIHSALRKASR